ncbi:MAG: pantoate--beta-alanine ligase [Actinomycetota bacterium]|nr:pantoate--beta-alanine ligase [Actinomycetota bacterium]
MRTVDTFVDARAAGSGCVGLVPTMGYLHEGHISLVEAARRECDTVIVSLFVNPLQFAPTEDLESYPRDLERDAEMVEAAGADVLFAPPLAEMYPEEPLTTVSVASVTEGMEGGMRPGHFDGVATVVAKLFAGIVPDRAYFGRKDAQQLVTVGRMTRDLSFPTSIIGAPIVREHDGLALSSRNIYLDPAERRAARSLSQGIFGVAEAVLAGERSGKELERIAAAAVNNETGIDLDYATFVDQSTAVPLVELDRPAFLATAARVGRTRLLDNVHIDQIDGGWVPDVGIRLDGPSILYREA